MKKTLKEDERRTDMSNKELVKTYREMRDRGLTEKEIANQLGYDKVYKLRFAYAHALASEKN